MIEHPREFHHYPFSAEEDKKVVKYAIRQQTKLLLRNPLFDNIDRRNTLSTINNYFDVAEKLFEHEEKQRLMGATGANLFYHGKEHAVYQTTYDGIVMSQAILSNDNMKKHLTPDGALAITLGAMFHDAGYVFGVPHKNVNYAARVPVHVEESMKAVGKYIDEIGIPKEYDAEKVKKLAQIGIYNTSYPLTDRHKMVLKIQTDRLDPKTRKEAHLVRLAIQFADLGGQTARVDYFPKLAKRLRDEINGAIPGRGTEIIGTDDELPEKGVAFINRAVKKEVGKIANAFFGSYSNPFSNEWEKACR